jgi:indole-3-glycerol phosphate synthase
LARDLTDLPLLRKEFVIDPYQLIEAKAYGADAVLLIAAILSTQELSELSAAARDLGLEILVEVHNSEELERSRTQDIDMLGVNNRNLKTFEVSISTSMELIDQIPQEVVPISESGISDPESVKELKQAGYQGFLIGENFMKAEEPGRALTEFLNATQ